MNEEERAVIALFPGSFDPFTNGHLDVAERAAAVADRLIIGVGINPAKRGLIAPEDRVDLIREATAHLTGVEVTLLAGATMDEAARLGATLIVKGVRRRAERGLRGAAGRPQRRGRWHRHVVDPHPARTRACLVERRA